MTAHGTTGMAEQYPEVISAVQFRAVIEHIIERHEQEYPPADAYVHEKGDGRSRPRMMTNKFITGRGWLEHETGVNYRSIYRMCYEVTWIPAQTVEKVIQKLGLTHLLHDGTITVVPNPLWSEERWEAYWNNRRKC